MDLYVGELDVKSAGVIWVKTFYGTLLIFDLWPKQTSAVVS